MVAFIIVLVLMLTGCGHVNGGGNDVHDLGPHLEPISLDGGAEHVVRDGSSGEAEDAAPDPGLHRGRDSGPHDSGPQGTRCSEVQGTGSCVWFGGEFCRDYAGSLAEAETDCARFPGHVFQEGGSCPATFNAGCRFQQACFSVTEWKNDPLPEEAKVTCTMGGGQVP